MRDELFRLPNADMASKERTYPTQICFSLFEALFCASGSTRSPASTDETESRLEDDHHALQ